MDIRKFLVVALCLLLITVDLVSITVSIFESASVAPNRLVKAFVGQFLKYFTTSALSQAKPQLTAPHLLTTLCCQVALHLRKTFHSNLME